MTVLDATQLNYFGTNPHVLTIKALYTGSGNFATNTLTVYLSFVHQAPYNTNSAHSVTVWLQLMANSLHSWADQLSCTACRPDRSIRLLYSFGQHSSRGTHLLDLDPASGGTFRNITVLDAALLDPANNPYVITIEIVESCLPRRYCYLY